MSDSLWPLGLQHTRPPCPSLSLRVCPSSCPLNQWYHPTVSTSVILFSFCFQFFPILESFPMIRLFASGGQSIETSASISVLPMNIQGWLPLRWVVIGYQTPKWYLLALVILPGECSVEHPHTSSSEQDYWSRMPRGIQDIPWSLESTASQSVSTSLPSQTTWKGSTCFQCHLWRGSSGKMGMPRILSKRQNFRPHFRFLDLEVAS